MVDQGRIQTSLSDLYSPTDWETFNKANVSIIDLSGVPFEVLSITISLISRIIFDFCFYFSKLKHERSEVNDVPFMIVCEEAHNYVPRSGSLLNVLLKKEENTESV